MTYEKVVSMLIPSMLASIMTLLGWMGNSLYKISESLAVVSYRIHNHEGRITSLEIWRQDQPISAPARRR